MERQERSNELTIVSNPTSAKAGTSRSATARDVRLDAVRGLLLVVMTVDHLPGPLRDWVHEVFGYVSAAEGFVFLSGFVAGLTYSRISYTNGNIVLWTRVVQRAGLIYIYHAFTFIFLLLILRRFAGNESYWTTWKPLLQENLAMAILRGCTLLYQPRFLDILPMYCLFVLLIPTAIQWAKSGPYLLVTSSLLWSLAQFGLPQKVAPSQFLDMPINLGDFDIFAWQLLFLAGLYAGFLRYRSGEQQASPWKVFGPCAVVVSGVLFCLKHGLFDITSITGQISLLTDKHFLGPLRLLNFLAVSAVASMILRAIKPTPVIRTLAYLGRHSLQVFSYQILLVHFVDLVAMPDIGGLREIAIVIVCVISLYLPAWFLEP